MLTSLSFTYRLLAALLVLSGLLAPLGGALAQESAAPAEQAADSAAPASAAPVIPTASSAAAAALPEPPAAPHSATPPGPQPVATDNPYGITAIWQQGDWVSSGTLLILALMSAASWYVIVVKLIEQSRLRHRSRQVKRSFWRQDDVRQASAQLKRGSEFRFVADAGLIAHQQYTGELTREVDRNTWLSQSIGEAVDAVGERLQGGLAVLATVGSTAPFIGLFGTVWGIYHALTAIGIAGQASIDKVAGPVGEALIMTAIGLAVAVPAVLGYNWLVRRNKAALDDVRGFGSELHTVLLGGQSAASLGGR
ncbi:MULTISPECIES: MotA/TolQ/ExbB proton channel family protein [Brenneria]|uniref:Biopolymer transport protein ExbB n=1 Tax=Brenneria nigrifluens DSM 30175 = ATCC 13028 TaxID=1121120 RepID=A0A2U1URM3_9GAMM|nr:MULTISPECIES: MotA/TolQ/ExbB proton channel family protein [Brenneria]EHD23150.1 MotA/TolQ/ExbB proton channel [Brenneria sp. EniD312]PWC24241.1 MotA/TolQ/ExbB proton channel family protein [Brenneria nigrifluens DSM 30175 = ATCC 13028]QCR06032.1 MotA/TolQ/ExbB proton channel family protein [Brenneria nigrifluens DSM 30175 = ATCC 13028]